MVAILSPARNLRPATAAQPLTVPEFAGEAQQLAAALRAYSPWQLESLLDVPPERALQLYDTYQAFGGDGNGQLYPALLAYNGAAYRNMSPEDFTPAEMAYAQAHLRVLSALYGMLRPLDGVQIHRLGLKKEFSPGGENLHAFWGSKLYRSLFAKATPVVNLASMEYAKLVTPFMQPGDRMVTCRFLVDKPGGARGTVSTVRAARGLMARFMVKHQLAHPEELQAFEEDGYVFIPARSTGSEYVFIKRRAWV